MSTVTIMAGDGGMGKSMQAQRYPEPLAYLDFEYPKGDLTRKNQNGERLITMFPCREFYGYKLVKKDDDYIFEKTDIPKGFKKGQINIPKSYELIQTTINHIIDISSDFETIVLDSISDIREIVADVWLIEYRKKDSKNANRKVIGKDPSAWSAINKIVCDDILFPIINIGRIENKNIVFTARMEDEYKTITLESGKEDTAKSGKRVIDAQNWITFEIDVIAQLDATEKGKYFMSCKKTPQGVIPKTDITGKNVYDVLCDNGVM